MVENIIDFEAEIRSKLSYNPTGISQNYDALLWTEFQFDLDQFNKRYELLNNRSPWEYFRRNQLDAIVYNPPKKDPNDWRPSMRFNGIRDAHSSYLSFVKYLNFQCQPAARDWLGNMAQSMGMAAGHIIDYVNLYDSYDEKADLKDYALSRDGVLFTEVSLVKRTRLHKFGDTWTPDKSIKNYNPEAREVNSFFGIESNILKPNRVYLGAIAERDIKKQPHIWKEVVMTYAQAYQLFHTWEMWKYVKPYSSTYDNWTDNDVDIETEDDGRNYMVRMRVYENLPRSETALYLNRVRMTPIGMKMPEDFYSVLMQQFDTLDPHFYIGRSFISNIRPYCVMLDMFRNIKLGRSMQGMEPPLAGTFRTLVNKYMFKPGSYTQKNIDERLEPLIPQNLASDGSYEMMQMLEKSIKNASVSDPMRGQMPGHKMTAKEVEEVLIASIRQVANLIAANVGWRKQEAEIKLKLAMKYYPKMFGGDLSKDVVKMRKMVVESDGGSNNAMIFFSKLPGEGEKSARAKILQKMSQTESSAKNGTRVKTFVIDPDEVSGYSFLIDYRTNPSQMDSELASIEKVQAKYDIYMKDPNIDKMATSTMLLRANGDDVQEFLQKQQPQAPTAPQQPPPPGMQPQQSPNPMQPQPQPMMQ